jgi:hypothetical protein
MNEQDGWSSPATLGLLGYAAGALDPNGGMGAGFQNAMSGILSAHQMRLMKNQEAFKKAQAQMKHQEVLRQIEMRNWWQQNIRPGDTSRDVANKVLSSGYPELLTHIKSLPQHKGKIEAVDEQGKPVVKFIDSVGNIENTGETPWKAPIKMDQGGFNALIDPVTMRAVAQYGKTMSPDAGANLAQRKYEFGIENARNDARFNLDYNPNYQSQLAAAKTTGTQQAKNRVEAISNLPKVIDQANESIKLIDDLVNHPGFELMVGKSNPAGELAAFVPGTAARDFKARFDQIKGKQFLEAYETLKGGGQITEIEGIKATQAVSRMERAQSEEEFKNAAQEFQGIIRKGVERAANKAGQQAPQSNQKSFMSPDGWSSFEN